MIGNTADVDVLFAALMLCLWLGGVLAVWLSGRHLSIESLDRVARTYGSTPSRIRRAQKRNRLDLRKVLRRSRSTK